MLQSFQKVFWSSIALFHQAVAPDTDPAQAKVLAATQKPYSKSILAEKSGPPAWKQLPSWYQVSENDSLIPPVVERMFAKQINAGLSNN